MLQAITAEQAREIADLAKTTREARDSLLGDLDDADFGEPPAARGEHNPAAALGFSPLPPDSPQLRALQEAINALSRSARSELFAIVRIGESELAADDWDGLLAEAGTLGDRTVTGMLLDDVDLHDHIAKGLYELKVA